ncbi:YigZ family protein [Nakamurella sp. GG22]
MRSIAGSGSHELEIQRSRFVCSLARVRTVNEAAAFIADIRRQNWAATHNCTAFRVGPGGAEQRSNDDGEPAGTAGVPMLEVLTRRELTDTAAVVTRYYGGVKLGAGGLIRAYGRSVAETVDAVGTVRLVPHVTVTVTAAHADAGKLENELRSAGRRMVDIEYGADVRLTVHVPEQQVPAFVGWVADHTGGRASAVPGALELVDIPD